MLDVKVETDRSIIDVREIIKDGAHPRFEIFDYVKEAPTGTTFEIHVPRRAKPLVNGLEDMGLKVKIEELGPSHYQITTTK